MSHNGAAQQPSGAPSRECASTSAALPSQFDLPESRATRTPKPVFRLRRAPHARSLRQGLPGTSRRDAKIAPRCRLRQQGARPATSRFTNHQSPSTSCLSQITTHQSRITPLLIGTLDETEFAVTHRKHTTELIFNRYTFQNPNRMLTLSDQRESRGLSCRYVPPILHGANSPENSTLFVLLFLLPRNHAVLSRITCHESRITFPPASSGAGNSPNAKALLNGFAGCGNSTAVRGFGVYVAVHIFGRHGGKLRNFPAGRSVFGIFWLSSGGISIENRRRFRARLLALPFLVGVLAAASQAQEPAAPTQSATAPAATAAVQSTTAAAPPATTSPQSSSSRENSSQKKAPEKPQKHKLGPLDVTVNWRTRVEGWDWFQGSAGNNNYALGHSLLRLGIGQQSTRFDWNVEIAQATIFGLPSDAVVAAPQGQLGLGGTYYAANGNHTNNAYVFLKQGFLVLKAPSEGARFKLGRFEYFDGLEVKPKDPVLATLIATRIAHRLISNFGFSAVQRSFDGAQFAWDDGPNNVTLLAARPTRGVFQVDGMGELDIDTYYGAYTRSVATSHSAGELRVFALGYIDHRTTVLKTDNRPQAVRAADIGKIEIATYGADYAHVLHTAAAGTFDALAWGVYQGGSWGALSQHAGAFVGEFGWHPPVASVKPWLSAGYSFGSGDGNPNDTRHGTFFQVLTTPRLYARFPFYNMMNNEDFYGTLDLHPLSRLSIRSEAHALRLANAEDLWYLGGGAFQRKTFGYTGRPGGGARSLANVWDISADYQITHSFSTTLYYGHAWGKSVIDHIYPQNPNGQFAYLETNFRF